MLKWTPHYHILLSVQTCAVGILDCRVAAVVAPLAVGPPGAEHAGVVIRILVLLVTRPRCVNISYLLILICRFSPSYCIKLYS